MSWNIEIACIWPIAHEPLPSLMPDVFTATNATLGFEDATSSARSGELCVAQQAAKVIVIDVDCRLSGAEDYLATVSHGRNVHVVRLADAPLDVRYRDGTKLHAQVGKDMLFRLLHGRAPAADERIDGEDLAMALLAHHAGVRFPANFWDLRFVVFAPD